MDRRLTPANGRVALETLRGRIAASRYVQGEPARIAVPIADLLSRPGGSRDRQVLMGERVLVLERRDDFAFIQAEKDGYCGYLAEAALGPDRNTTHWVSVPATHLYVDADLKSPDNASLTLGAQLKIEGKTGNFLETTDGQFVPLQHVSRLGDWNADPASVAESLIGTPYLWGGNSRSGIDCSGLVQAALLACGIACPGDSDMQESQLGRPLAEAEALQRGDLLFWKGHVAIATSPTDIVHANAFHMAVQREETARAIERIAGQGDGPVTTIRRL